MSKLNEMELRQLALKIRDGDQKAMTHFYEQTIHIVYGMVKSKVYNEEDAKDVVQNIYISFYTSIKSYDEQRPFVSCLVFQSIYPFVNASYAGYVVLYHIVGCAVFVFHAKPFPTTMLTGCYPG